MYYATDFGCDPTGTSDSTAAMQAFLLAARASVGVIPAGTYKISQELYFGYNCATEYGPDLHAEAFGAGKVGGWLRGEGPSNTILKWTGTTDDSSSILRVSSPHCRITGIQFWGSSNKVGHGIVFQHSHRAIIEQCRVRATSQAGFYWNLYWRGYVADPQVADSTPYTYHMLVENCEAVSCGAEGFYLSSGGGTGAQGNVLFVNCVAQSNSTYGFRVQCSGNGVQLHGCRARSNGSNGFQIEGDLNGSTSVRSVLGALWADGNTGQGLYFAGGADSNLVVGGNLPSIVDDGTGVNPVLVPIGGALTVSRAARTGASPVAQHDLRFRADTKEVISKTFSSPPIDVTLDFDDLC
ncbi:MAG TPA: right-handed parallel beta-helix repeat-containing protein [Polyangiaceae bacterium]|nr:right-handed parallel beta-helix repeat-containing protein [Polyangiaceae bacterium]